MNIREQFEFTKRRRQLLVNAMPQLMNRVSENTQLSHSDGHLDKKNKRIYIVGYEHYD